MTGKEAHKILDEAISSLEPEAPGDIVKMPERHPNASSTRDWINGNPVRFLIGTGGPNDDKKLSDFEAMDMIVPLFHEVCGHGSQLKYEQDKTDPSARIVMLNYYACKRSDAYYDGCAAPGQFTDEYAAQPFEIAAQYMGIRCAREYLSSKNGAGLDKNAVDRMLLNYVNKRRSMGSEFIPKARIFEPKFGSLDEALSAFESQFQECATEPHFYNRAKGAMEYDCLHSNGYYRSKVCHIDLPGMVAGSISPVHQDMMMCAVLLHDEPHAGERFQHKVFLDLDLSISNVFGKEPVWPAADITKAAKRPFELMTDMIAEIDKKNAMKSRPNGIRGPDKLDKPEKPDGPEGP